MSLPKRPKQLVSPWSSNMRFDMELSHPSHHHKLRKVHTEAPFLCNGCREAGIGLKYACAACDFDLHKVCASAPASVTHPFYPNCTFHFHAGPPGPGRRFCDACHRDVQGFVYHCRRCGFDLHPCCADLPQCLSNEDQRFYLCAKLRGQCHCCGLGGKGWCYRSECGSYSLHVACVKELVVESWQGALGEGEKKRRVEARMPSLKGVTVNHHGGGGGGGLGRRGGKVKRCCEIAGGALRIIVGALLGDPTAVIAAVIGGFITK